jgi:hypothetical protein
MSRRWRARWTLLATLGFAHWFFGNLYEAVVFSPNWVLDSASQLTRLNEFFVRTSPTLYFVPVISVAAPLAWGLHATNHDLALRSTYRLSSLFALLAVALNTFIVATVITRLFGDDYAVHSGELNGYAWRWNVLNVLRMALVAATTGYLFSAFRRLERS